MSRAHCEANHEVSYEINGSCLQLLQLSGVYQNGHRFYWSSSEFHTNKNQAKIFDSNVLLASVIVLSGNSYAKIKMLFNFMRLATISPTTFYNYQRQFIFPAVNKFYIQSRQLVKYSWYQLTTGTTYVAVQDKEISTIRWQKMWFPRKECKILYLFCYEIWKKIKFFTLKI